MEEKKQDEAAFDVDIEPTQDDNPVDPELEEIEATSSNKLKTLRDKLKACEAEKMEALEAGQRAKADFLNARRRLEEERARDKERVIDQQIEKLLPVYDSFTMAMQNKAAWEAIDETWRTGIESIFNQFKNVLDSYQVEVIDQTDVPFDPQLHEAMSEEPVTNATSDHTVLRIIQAGFTRTIDEQPRLIRPARVVVGTFSK